jgi:aspartyl-tRNA synthetase
MPQSQISQDTHLTGADLPDEEVFRTTQRTHLCGALRASHAGQQVRLGGWVHRNRDLGGLLFLDLRDRAGVVQVSVDPRRAPPETMQAAAASGTESVILVEGEVVARPPEMRNAELATGEIEVRATRNEVVGPATTPQSRSRAARARSCRPRSCGSDTATSICVGPSCKRT